MIKLEKWETFGWEAAIRGMRNPMNSWEKSDSDYTDSTMEWSYDDEEGYVSTNHRPSWCGSPAVCIGPNDLNLMENLRRAGTDHRKYLRMITVYVDITAPLYWWKEFDTYKVGTVANSCSTMHKIQAKEFTIDDFSHEHLTSYYPTQEHDWKSLKDNDLLSFDDADYGYSSFGILELIIIRALNFNRKKYLETKDKKYWWQMIQLLPTSYNQKRTVMLNYEVLNNIYISRQNHKLDEWHDFCHWIESLPYAKELIKGED